MKGIPGAKRRKSIYIVVLELVTTLLGNFPKKDFQGFRRKGFFQRGTKNISPAGGLGDVPGDLREVSRGARGEA